MSSHVDWTNLFRLDIEFGYVGTEVDGPRHYNPRLVLNQNGSTVGEALLEELDRCQSFTFSVAFISAAAIAQLKQHLVDFEGAGCVITSDFLGFNEPQAFAELLNLQRHTGIDVRRHTSRGFHPKGYVFDRGTSITAMIGSSNLTSSALSQNQELNLRVSAAPTSDLANQLKNLLDGQLAGSEPLTQEWIDAYAVTYLRRAPSPEGLSGAIDEAHTSVIGPNSMQRDALLALDFARADGAKRAVIISATGTGKTILSALDVRSVNPLRLLFVVHREQILDRTIEEYRRTIGGPATNYGKLTGAYKQADRRYVFATIQTLSQPSILSGIAPDAFDYVIVDEAHRAGAETYQRVIDHLRPTFLLGMTATPERTDGFNVFELFHYNVPYEIRLNEALEAEMLAPFHYYGVADVTFDDGTTTTDETELRLLITPQRVQHLLNALALYGQAGVAPRGLIFCSRKEEARSLSAELNRRSLHGAQLHTVALTGDDSVEVREQRVADLESGGLDYILTVDVFNEGVDIPSVNQIIMLRQTQSAIVFVQQLGRGLRKANGKDYLVVIDFIGNYTNNFLIPIALFGNESLSRESLRERLTETVDGAPLPGLSSVSFDEVARERVLNSIVSTKLDSLANLKSGLLAMRHRVGGIPTLWDFYRFESVDPVLLATTKAHYPALVLSLLGVDPELTPVGNRALALLSNEVLSAKRQHELILLDLLLQGKPVTVSQIAEAFQAHDLSAHEIQISTAVDTLALRGYSQAEAKRYGAGIAEQIGESVQLTKQFVSELSNSKNFDSAVLDLLKTGKALTSDRYSPTSAFTPGMQYSRRDAARIVGWPRTTAVTIFGYKTDVVLGVCTIFVTLHKAEDVGPSTAYLDALLDQSTMRWFSKNNRTLTSKDVKPIIEERVKLHVFVQKDDAEGSEHYYLGSAIAQDARETTIAGKTGQPLPIVMMTLRFQQPIRQGLFDYFRPSE